MKPVISIIMGSKSDWATMQKAAEVLDNFGVAYEKKVVSAHRTPDLMFKHAEEARSRGIKVIIAGVVCFQLIICLHFSCVWQPLYSLF